jgi:hypothetical protein
MPLDLIHQSHELDQPTLPTEAPARVFGVCLMVVKTAKMIASPMATEDFRE